MPLDHRGLTLLAATQLEPPSQVYSNSRSFHLEVSCLLVNPTPVLAEVPPEQLGELSLLGAFVQLRASISTGSAARFDTW